MKPRNDKNFKEIYDRLRANTHWYNKSYSAYPIGIYQQGLAIAHEAAVNEYGLKYGMCYQNYTLKDHFDWFWDVNDMKEKRAKILAKVKSDHSFADVVLKAGDLNNARFAGYSLEVSKLDVGAASNETLLKTYRKLQELLVDVSIWSYACDAFLSDGEKDWLVEIIETELGDKATNEVVEVLTFPTFSSFVNEAEVQFLKIVAAIKSGDEKMAGELANEYEQRYFWIRSNYKAYKRVRAADILAEAREWPSRNPTKVVSALIREDEERIPHNIAKKAELSKKLGLSDDLKSTLRLSEVFTHLQDNRKERVLRMNTLFYEFIAETEKRFNIPNPLGYYLTDREIFGLYEKTFASDDLIRDAKVRYDVGFLAVFHDDTATLVSAEQFRKDGIDKTCFKKHDDITEFKGTVAFKGVVRGKARILRNIQEIATFGDGEILVANQTTPEYVPAMKKAVAIVTDQGGITCHAAIVARELKIPAVIGTKIATKVLKDGDMIEVDAQKGIVRILK